MFGNTYTQLRSEIQFLNYMDAENNISLPRIQNSQKTLSQQENATQNNAGLWIKIPVHPLEIFQNLLLERSYLQ